MRGVPDYERGVFTPSPRRSLTRIVIRVFRPFSLPFPLATTRVILHHPVPLRGGERLHMQQSKGKRLRFYLMPGDWTWWVWLFTGVLLAVGLTGRPIAFIAAMLLTVVQCIVMLLREGTFLAFPVQIRFAYFLVLFICSLPHLRWLYWVPMLGTFALVLFGYCILARVLSLMPWNRREPLTDDLLHRTFRSRPDPSRVKPSADPNGCAGSLCSIEAQVAPAD